MRQPTIPFLTLVLAGSVLVSSLNTAMSNEVYLDKLDKKLDDLYNAYDEMCRGAPGRSSMSNYGCDKRNEVSAKLKRMGYRNIYPATNPHDTSYWKCKR
jgi:hypothetical protein